jgi:NDP-sugar pyrophosphorylase family protein
VRVLVVENPARPDFDGRWRFAGASLMPFDVATSIEPVPSSLYDVVWAPRHARGELELVVHAGEFIDCGTPADLQAANEAATGR